ncbi:MAG: tyrosine-type recombinase/integrase [Pseudonocardiales bacterium]|nr:tyrosine-type recombinase/integrase [Pseudonocardiales bacterium]
MGHIQDRWYKKVIDPDTKNVSRVKTGLHSKGMRYKVRYLDPDGRELSKMYPDRQLSAAKAFLHDIESAKQQGTYLNPHSGKVTFQNYAEEWLTGQSFKPTTRCKVPSRLKNQVYPFLGNIELGSITPTTIRNWIRWMTDRGIAPSYRHLCFVHVSAILSAAIDDKKIATNPCNARSVTRPHRGQHKVVPWSDARVKAVWLALPPRVQITVPLGAGEGLRQGEMFGLSPDDIDREAMLIRIVRQVQPVEGKLVFCLPKGEKTRDVPLSDHVLTELDAYLEIFPPTSVTLPWEEPDGEPTTATLIMTDEAGGAWRQWTFNRVYWQPALERVGVTNPTRADGTHALRHYYASALLDGGENIKALSEYLGHADPGFTLRTYTHLMPSSHERTRRVIDTRLGPLSRPGHGLRACRSGKPQLKGHTD